MLNEIDDLISIWDHRTKKWHTLSERRRLALVHRGQSLISHIYPWIDEMTNAYATKFASSYNSLAKAAFDKRPNTGYVTLRLSGEEPPNTKIPPRGAQNSTFAIWTDWPDIDKLLKAIREVNAIVLQTGSTHFFNPAG